MKTCTEVVTLMAYRHKIGTSARLTHSRSLPRASRLGRHKLARDRREQNDTSQDQQLSFARIQNLQDRCPLRRVSERVRGPRLVDVLESRQHWKHEDGKAAERDPDLPQVGRQRRVPAQ